MKKSPSDRSFSAAWLRSSGPAGRSALILVLLLLGTVVFGARAPGTSIAQETNYQYLPFVNASAGGNTATATPTSGEHSSLPLRAAFYYPWFPEAWTQLGIYPYTKYTPSLGFYDNADQAVIQQHMAAMQYGGIGAGILSWWGQGTHTDAKVPAILAATAGNSFRWAIYYEPESQGNPSVPTLAADLAYIRDHYGSDPGFLRIDGRFVVFVYCRRRGCVRHG